MGPEVDAFEREVARRRRAARDRRVVGHRRPAGRADGPRHRPWRRGRHHDVLVLRHRRLHRARWRPPVLVDIDPETFNIDAIAAARAITPRTRAIMPVHLFGQSADMERDPGARQRAGLAVIEDAAQAIGATYHGGQAGGIGASAASRSSRARTSALRRRRPGHDQRRRRWRASCGCFATTAWSRSTSTSWSAATSASTRIQAAVLRVKLPHLAAWTRRRGAPMPRATASCSPTQAWPAP